MTFDLYGRNPKNSTGMYFGVNNWAWRPIAVYVINNVPMSPNECKYWGTNDGQKVSERLALRIAKKLKELKKSGEMQKHEDRLTKNALKHGEEPPFEVELTMKFAKFCEKSGGFIIC
jgi:hypothetical protein